MADAKAIREHERNRIVDDTMTTKSWHHDRPKDMLKSGGGTKMTVTNIKLNENIPESIFNKANLK